MIRIENQQCRVQTVNSNKKLVQIKLSSTPVCLYDDKHWHNLCVIFVWIQEAKSKSRTTKPNLGTNDIHGQCLWTAAVLPSYLGRLNWSLIHSLVWRYCLCLWSLNEAGTGKKTCSTDVCTSQCSSTVYQQGEAVLLEARVEALMHPPVTVYVDSCVATLKPDPLSLQGYRFITNQGWVFSFDYKKKVNTVVVICE